MFITLPRISYRESTVSRHVFFFFFNDTATTEIYTLSLHDALPICGHRRLFRESAPAAAGCGRRGGCRVSLTVCLDRKSTRLNSSHDQISYAVFCLKKKKTTRHTGSQSERSCGSDA